MLYPRGSVLGSLLCSGYANEQVPQVRLVPYSIPSGFAWTLLSVEGYPWEQIWYFLFPPL